MTDLRHIGLDDEVKRMRERGCNIRNQWIFLNQEMSELHSKLGLSDKLRLINVGEVPNDCTGDLIGEAIAKTAENVRNVIDALDEQELDDRDRLARGEL